MGARRPGWRRSSHRLAEECGPARHGVRAAAPRSAGAAAGRGADRAPRRERGVPRGLVVDQEDQPPAGDGHPQGLVDQLELAGQVDPVGTAREDYRAHAVVVQGPEMRDDLRRDEFGVRSRGRPGTPDNRTTRIHPAHATVVPRLGGQPLPEGRVPELSHHHRAVRRRSFSGRPHESDHVGKPSADVRWRQREKRRREARRVGPGLQLLDPRRQVAERIPGRHIGVGDRLHRCASCVVGKQSGQHPGHVADESPADASRPPSLPEIVGEPLPGVELRRLGGRGLDPAHGVVESPPQGALGTEPVEGGEELPLVGAQLRRAGPGGIGRPVVGSAVVRGPVVGRTVGATFGHGHAPRTYSTPPTGVSRRWSATRTRRPRATTPLRNSMYRSMIVGHR